ncbi:N-acetylneuraminate synthase family protein [Planktomarina temperata]|nr:N-acetylneuraminate synthase family protein [Planktomarina temperata]
MTRIIMEVGSIHDGSFGNAVKAVEFAAKVDVDIVKFQMHIADAETTRYAQNPGYFNAEPRFEYFERTAFTLSQWKELKAHADQLGITFLISPFSIEAVDILDQLSITNIKVASGETSNLPLLRRLNDPKYSIMVSTGMSDFDEIDRAVSALNTVSDLTVLQCTSEYPCPLNHVYLPVIAELKKRYPHVSVGFSDHTSGSTAAVLSVAFGAEVVEKHFSFSNLMYGSDAKFGLEPLEFRKFVLEIRNATELLKGLNEKVINDDLLEMKKTFEKSIVAKMDLEAGTKITTENLAFKKPGTGMPAHMSSEILDKTLKRKILQDEQIKEGDLE